tara:strand:+ start:2121 stop:2426 length:306 start_codon:yes stop_codon:yes gene_type:complete
MNSNGVETKSIMTATLKIKTDHEGEVTEATRENLVAAIRVAVKEMFEEETGDEEFVSSVSIYVESYEYGDNLSAIRKHISESLKGCSTEQLQAIMEAMTNE